MTAAARVVLVTATCPLVRMGVLVGALVAVGGLLAPSSREAVGALPWIIPFGGWMGYRLLRRKP